MSEKYIGRCVCPSEIVYNAVDIDVFKPLREKKRKASDQRCILVVGSHGDPARFIYAMEVVAALRKIGVDVRLEIRGHLRWKGAYRQLCEFAASQGAGDYFAYGGPFAPADAPAVYSEADVLLHLQHGDACPTVILEAMACGLPVVAPASGGIPELVGSCGALLDAPDAEERFVFDAQDAVSAVLRVFEGAGEYSVSSRDRVVRLFDARQWLEKHGKIFRTVIAS
jgi:glycosyltransferase involved in cell wall biosynthesis